MDKITNLQKNFILIFSRVQSNCFENHFKTWKKNPPRYLNIKHIFGEKDSDGN